MTSEPMTSPAEENPANTVIPAEPEVSQEKAQDPRELLAELRSRFEVFRTFQPLAIGIDKAVRQHFPEVDRKTLRIALSMHTHCNRYLRLLAKAEQRFDLEGQPVAEVSEEHRQFASTALEERMQRQASERAKQPRHPDNPRKAGNSSKPSGRSAGRRNHGKTGNAQSDNPASSEASTNFVQNTEKPEDKKSPKKPWQKKHEKSGKNAAKTTAPDAKTPPPAATASLAEKLALLTEKFSRK